MSKNVSTPGPWRVETVKSGTPDECYSIVADGHELAALWNLDPNNSRWFLPSKANATLMASAPSLLKACELAVAAMGPNVDATRYIQAAIDAAKGRP